jgi:hypothetical protein
VVCIALLSQSAGRSVFGIVPIQHAANLIRTKWERSHFVVNITESAFFVQG